MKPPEEPMERKQDVCSPSACEAAPPKNLYLKGTAVPRHPLLNSYLSNTISLRMHLAYTFEIILLSDGLIVKDIMGIVDYS
jgi:hypothetical protein